MIEKVWDDSWSFQSFQSYFYKRTNMRIFQHEGFTPIRSELLNSLVSGLFKYKFKPRTFWSLSKSDMGCNSNIVIPFEH
jgi:hypothetical protein